MKKEFVLEVKIDDLNLDEAISLVKGWLSNNEKHWIATPNPEMVMLAQKDLEFKQILNSADLSIPDGVGLKLVGVKNRVTGVDLMEQLIQFDDISVGLLGSAKGVAEKASECLLKKYPGINFAYINDGGPFIDSKTFDIPKLDILFVAFGHGKQEKWIDKNLANIPVKVAMGVGGAFDYFSGNVPRAPKILRTLGLEWIFRLLIQPWRIKRQLVLISFVWKILLAKLK
jgi:N-acetylglucosaminyldiphosphoundecaprenol N-acetyl-beta-D-mannosaminyltransferase